MNNKMPKMLLLLFLSGGFYNLWTLRPVNIAYVYSDAGSTLSIVVDHLPWTDKEKIDWYISRREELARNYPLYNDSIHSINILDIGEGFTNYNEMPDEDLLCFPTIQTDRSCILREHLLIVNEYPDRKAVFYIVSNQTTYQLVAGDKIERVQRPD
ncbi:DUF943 family protein [Lelliottia sp. WAP21]|uniref:DUF943 family protein n=1 Tax=Lelliottia sp. WAP21 TaxID=2877426 RepID=UPI001E3B9C44|nr:DUF943 family protein [Lelliottia sp. WAP21]